MAYLKVGSENSTPINLYFEDHGQGEPVVLIHGWPLNSRSWEKQLPILLDAGFRVITYDRRGFGQSTQCAIGFDSQTLASDLNILMTELNLHNAILVGFSMGGVEVAKYLSSFGADRTQKAVFISSVTPYLLKSEDNPEGVEASVFENIRKKLIADRPQFLTQFFKDFYNAGYFEKVSEEAIHASWIHGIMASPVASLKSVDTWLVDLRTDLKRIKIPTLVIHGDMDKTVPVKASGSRMSQYLENCEYQQLISAPHGLIWTHADELNAMLLKFIASSAAKTVKISSAEQELGLH